MPKKEPFHLWHLSPGCSRYVTCTAVHKRGEHACLRTNPRSFLTSGWFTTKTPERTKEIPLLPAGGRAASSLNSPVFPRASCSRDAGMQLSASFPAAHHQPPGARVGVCERRAMALPPRQPQTRSPRRHQHRHWYRQARRGLPFALD